MATKAAKLLDTPSFQPRFTFLRRIFRILSIIFAKGNGTCWWPYLLLILFSGLSEVVTYFSGKSISLFYLYLTSKDANQFHILLGTMTGYYIAGSFLRGLTSYASGLFALRARNRLSLILHTYMIQRIDLDIDNPDQRITQDVDRLAESLRIILESLVIDPPLIILYSYQTAMVGGTVNLFGPGMIYLYFFFSCVVCRIAIGPLIQLICKREEKEGDYRALHIRFREYEQSIRQSCGCHYETLVVDQCLEALLALQHRILLFNIPLKTILEFINFFGGILSYALIAIPIFSGELDNKTPSELSALISESSFVCMYLIYRFTMITALSDVFSEVFGYTARVGQMIDILDNELQKRIF